MAKNTQHSRSIEGQQKGESVDAPVGTQQTDENGFTDTSSIRSLPFLLADQLTTCDLLLRTLVCRDGSRAAGKIAALAAALHSPADDEQAGHDDHAGDKIEFLVLDNDRRNDEADQVDHLDHRIERRAGRVLQRIANRVAHDARLVAL